MTSKLEIVYKSIDDLIPYANNSRTHSPEQISQIAASIKEFGWRSPILVDGDNGIIAGHGRVLAARKLKITEIPTVDGADMTEAQKKAFIIADNKIALNAGWDQELLSIEISELNDLNMDLDILGFTEEEIDGFLGNAEETDLPELPDVDKDHQQMTFILHNEQADTVKEAVAYAKKHLDVKSDLNENSNGNAIAMICELFITQNGHG